MATIKKINYNGTDYDIEMDRTVSENIASGTQNGFMTSEMYNKLNTIPLDATTNEGTVKSVQVQATSPITSSQNTAQTETLSTTIALADAYGDTKNPYGSKTKNTVLASGASADGVPTFRTLVSADLPNAAMGQGYTSTSTAVGTAAKTASLTGYALTIGGVVTVLFTNGNTASNPTLNINSTGAKNIFWKGAALTDTALIKANDIVTFVYDGTQYQIISIERGTAITYSGTSNAPMSGVAVKSAIDALDGTITGTAGASKTLTAFSQTDGKVSATFGNISITKSQVSDFPTTMTPASHTHGKITNDGKIASTDNVAIANNDRLIISDASDSYILKNTSIVFDGSTETQALTKKGTWVTFNNYSHPTGDGNLHVPATSTTNNGKFLKAGSTAGSISWASLSSSDVTTALGYTPYNSTNPNGYTTNVGTITGVTGSDGLTGSGTSGSVTIKHAAPSTSPAKTTSAVYPITIDKYGHITAAGTAVTSMAPTAHNHNDTYYTKTEIDNKISAVFHYLGTKSTVANLPSSGNNTGDVYHVTADNSEYVWTGSAWEELGTAVDLSNYVEKDGDKVLSSNDFTDALKTKLEGIATGATANTGTVTSVRVQASSPLTSSVSTAQSGSLDTTISISNQNANSVLAGPSSGTTAAAPTFRSLVAADLPTVPLTKGGTGATSAADARANLGLGLTNIFYGTCDTAAGTAQKAVTLSASNTSNFVLETGATVFVKFTNSNTVGSATLKVGSTTAKTIYRYGTTAPGSSTSTSWEANSVIGFIYDGTYWREIGWNFQTNAAEGYGYGVCTIAAATKAKTVAITNYNLITGGIVVVKFDNGNTVANPTLSVNSKAAKNIFYNGAALTNTSLIKAGDIVTFIYDGTQYQIIGIASTKWDSAAPGAVLSGPASGTSNGVPSFKTIASHTYTPAGSVSVTLSGTSVLSSVKSAGAVPTLGTAFTIPNISKKTVVTGVTKQTVVKTASFNTVLAKAVVSNEVLSFTDGVSGSATTGDSVTVTTGDSVTVGTAFTVPNVTSVGSMPTFNTGTVGVSSASFTGTQATLSHSLNS